MDIGRVYYIIMRVIDKRRKEWIWNVMQDAQTDEHTTGWTLSDNNWWTVCQKELESMPLWVHCRNLEEKS